MDLVLSGRVSEIAIIKLSKEILVERGSLPVGEIGKVLQDTTASTSLSSKLKDKFGGLKKFLERLPEEFMMCFDHPFNPHVLVRKLLTPVDIEMVNKGFVPNHWTPKYKKVS